MNLTGLTNGELFDLGCTELDAGRTGGATYLAVRAEQARRAGPETSNPDDLLETEEGFTYRLLGDLS